MNRSSRFIPSFFSRMPAGDAVVAGVLVLLIGIACLVSLGALVRSFQISVPAHGGTLSEGVVGSPRFANPLLAISDSDRDLVALTYAGLMGHDAEGNLIPVLAQSYATSSEGTVYTFTLRSNAQFSDGTPVTADDVVYTVHKAQDSALKSPEYASWANIKVEALDSQTVRFTLPKAYTPFLEDATLGILPKHLWQNISDDQFAFASLNEKPVGAGPFIATKVSHDASGTITGYTLSAFSKYVLGGPYLSHIKLSFYSSQEDLAKAYADGSVKSAYGISASGARSAPYARVISVFFNPDKDAALADTDVRKALSLAIDRTTITQKLLGGHATPLAGPVPAGSGVPPLPLPSDASRIADAKAALDDAGYTYATSTQTWSKSGKELDMTLITSDVPELKTVAAQVQQDWRALGVPTELELHSASDLTQSVIRPRAYSALLFGEVVGTTPDLYAFWSSDERSDPGLNIADYSDKDVDTLLSSLRSEPDPVKRQTMRADAQEKIAADYPAAFLYTPDFLYDLPSYIHGVRLSQVSSPSDRFWGVQDWYRYTEHVWPIFAPTPRTTAAD